MVINANIAIKSGKSGRKEKTVIDNVGYCWHGLCTFPNLVINVNIVRKSGNIKKKKNRHGVDCCWQC